MKTLAAFVMRGRLPAIAVTAVAAMVPLLVWLSSAAVALVTLRRGPLEGLVTAAGGTAVLAVFAQLGGMAPWVALQAPLQVWLPMILVAACLRSTVSLGRSLEVAAGVAALAVVAFHWVVGNPIAYWGSLIEEVSEVFTDPAMRETLQAQSEQLAGMMTSLWFGNLLVIGVLSLLLARWWQALLYNPGGFGAEFRALRLSRPFAITGLVLLVLGGVVGGGLARDLALVVTSVFAFQALAVAHALVQAKGGNRLWLVLVYVTMAPFARVYALVGIVDVFVDLRRRAVRED